MCTNPELSTLPLEIQLSILTNLNHPTDIAALEAADPSITTISSFLWRSVVTQRLAKPHLLHLLNHSTPWWTSLPSYKHKFAALCSGMPIQAHVFNREATNTEEDFSLSSYHASLTLEPSWRDFSQPLSFTARYTPMGDRNDGNGNAKEVVEHHITVDRIRQCPSFVPNLHHNNINALVPGQYVELLWRGRASHPWGNWLGQVGRVDRISSGRTRLTLLFSQYGVGSPWRCVYIHLDDDGDDDDVVEDDDEDGGNGGGDNNNNMINVSDTTTTTTVNIKDCHQYGVSVNDNPLFGYIGGLYVVDEAGLEEWKRAASHHHLHEKQGGGDDVEVENAPSEEEDGGEESIVNEGTSAR